MSELKRDQNTILFIDEIHEIVGAGDNEGRMDAGNVLKPALARGELQLVGATTLNEYRTIEKTLLWPDDFSQFALTNHQLLRPSKFSRESNLNTRLITM